MVVFTASVRQRILDYIIAYPGIKARDISSRLWAERGRAPSHKTITTYIVFMNLALADHGYRLQGKQGPRGGYTLVRL